MLQETVTYEADGLAMVSRLYIGDGSGPRPGVLLFPEIFGVGEHVRSRAERLASLGYIALACDYNGDGHQFEDLDEARRLIEPLRADPRRIRARAEAGLAALKVRPEVDPNRVAAIGHCFGGTMALELARGGAEIAAVVGFHSGLTTVAPEDAKNIKAKILVCIGAEDPGIPPEQRSAFEEEMRAGGADWQMHLYGGVVHSFTNIAADRMGRPDFARYDARADARSWGAMLGLFGEVF